ncbi:MAG: hypothetical protein ACI9X4_001253 [Glaciecola sp.]|jgi:hypothetical protein
MGGRGSWGPVEPLEGRSAAASVCNVFVSKGLWWRVRGLSPEAPSRHRDSKWL